MIDGHTQPTAVAPPREDILAICRRAGEGDPVSQRQLMDLLFNRIHKTASYLTTSDQEAKDIAQTACIQVLRTVGTYRGEASITYWADRVTCKTAADVFRKKSRRQRIRESFFQPVPAVAAVDEMTERNQVRNKLGMLLRNLKQYQREIVVLHCIHGYTLKESAELCDIPVETARSRLKEGRKNLKKKVLADPVLEEWVREWIK